MLLKTSSAKWRPFCLGLNELNLSLSPLSTKPLNLSGTISQASYGWSSAASLQEEHKDHHINDLVKDCGNSSALAMELPQSYTKPLTWTLIYSISYTQCMPYFANSSSIEQNFADNIFKCIFMNETFCVFIQISLKFVPKGPIDNISVLVQEMAWHWKGNKSLSEPMLTQFTDVYM